MRMPDSLEINFTITDLKEEVTVNYSGILPDLFKEDAGVVAAGYYDQTNNSFQAFLKSWLNTMKIMNQKK